MKLYRRLKSPLCIQLELTSACNCKCSHCYNFWRPTAEKHSFITKEVADKIIQTMVDNEIQKICLTGGEPFLNFKMFQYVTERLQSSGIKVSTNTNLSVATKEQLDWVLQKNIKILTTVMGFDQITHDSMTNTKGSFEHTIQNIKRCIEFGNNILVNIVCTKSNMNIISSIASNLAEMGVKTIFASLVYCPEYAKGTDSEKLFHFNDDDIAFVLNSLLNVRDEYNVYVSTITTFPLCSLSKVRDISPFINRRCVAGRTEIGISSNGKVAPCTQSCDYVGDLMTEDFKVIWDRLSINSTAKCLPDDCVNCQLFKICSGGCRVSAKSDCGIWNGLDPNVNKDKVQLVINHIQENMSKFTQDVKTVSGHCRNEEFGSVLIRDDGNYLLLNDMFNDTIDINEKNILPIVLKQTSCDIFQDCNKCSLFNTCYSIHNCR